jgi:hypothetical protein
MPSDFPTEIPSASPTEKSANGGALSSGGSASGGSNATDDTIIALATLFSIAVCAGMIYFFYNNSKKEDADGKTTSPFERWMANEDRKNAGDNRSSAGGSQGHHFDVGDIYGGGVDPDSTHNPMRGSTHSHHSRRPSMNSRGSRGSGGSHAHSPQHAEYTLGGNPMHGASSHHNPMHGSSSHNNPMHGSNGYDYDDNQSVVSYNSRSPSQVGMGHVAAHAARRPSNATPMGQRRGSYRHDDDGSRAPSTSSRRQSSTPMGQRRQSHVR